MNNTKTTIDTFAAADGSPLRYGIWPTRKKPSRGGILLLNGRKEFLEKYGEVISELNHRCLDVFSMDWRGQGLSARPLPDRMKGHIDSFDTYLADLEHFMEGIVLPACRAPLLLMAHSMGGHLALRYLHRHPPVVERAILVAPMIDIRIRPLTRILLRKMVGWHRRWGDRSIPGYKGSQALGRSFDGNRLTSDPRRFRREQELIRRNPHLAVGGVTWGWMAAAFASIDELEAPGVAESIAAPILLASPADDRIVSCEAQRRICRRLPNGRFLSIPGARHELLMERDELREQFWRAFDRFVLEAEAQAETN
jgi:lysophospholipase